jgi:curved DNA-binding protein CbpA
VREHPPERDADQFKRIRAAYEILRDPARRAEWDLFVALLPPTPLPSRRRPKPDLAFHREDVVWVLRQEIRSSLQNAEDDFRLIEPPTLQG